MKTREEGPLSRSLADLAAHLYTTFGMASDFEQGSVWDFFLHALNIKKIPSPKERIEKGFESYIKTYQFNDQQIQILRDMKDIVSANIAERKKLTIQDVFNNPIFVRILGADYQEVNQIFDDHFPQVFEELQGTFKV
jgi:type I restriction enzyme R subunit